MKIEVTDVLVLMGCSATKRDAIHVPAFDLYDGPMWQTLRTHLGRIPRGNVCVLSGKYGFINALSRIRTYEARLTSQKADYLIDRGVIACNDQFGLIRPGEATGPNPLVEANGTVRCGLYPYRAVIVAASGEYERVFNSFAAEFQSHQLVGTPCTMLRVAGGIGEQRQQLGQWLDEINATAVAA